MTPRLEGRGLGYRAAGRWLVADVSIAVEAGEVLALVGPNGAGKSTLLALLAGDLRPAAGEVTLDGRPLGSIRSAELARLRAVLPQASVVQFAFTARQVVGLGRAPWARQPGGDDAAAVDAAMAAAGVAHLAGRSYLTLSGGEAARVALARVLAQDAPVVLLDEPTASLDLRHQEAAMAVARGLADAGRAVMVVLHDLNLAAAHTDRMGLMDGGRLVACGPPGDVLRAELLSPLYGIPVAVVPHPRRTCPLVVAGGAAPGALEAV